MLRPHKKGWLVKMKGIDTIEEAEAYKNEPVFILQDELKSSTKAYIYLAEVLYFSVFDKENKIGEVKSFESFSSQDYLIIEGVKSLRVPFVPSYIESIDFKNQTLHLNLPENFIETLSD